MLLLLRLQVFAVALLVFLAFDGVEADGSEMYYRTVYRGDAPGKENNFAFHVEYCWRKNPSSAYECLKDDYNSPRFHKLFQHDEYYEL